MSAWYLLLAFFFVLANGFFVASEFALVKVRPTQLAELLERGSVRAKLTKRILKRLDAYLAAAQVGITFASLALGWIGEPAFAGLIIPLLKSFGAFAEPLAHSIAISISFILISALHIVFGEQVPKFLAIEKPVQTALWTAHLLQGFFLITYPAIWVLRTLTNGALS